MASLPKPPHMSPADYDRMVKDSIITVADVQNSYMMLQRSDFIHSIHPFEMGSGECLCCEEEVGDEDAVAIIKQLENREKNCMWCGEDFDLTEEEIETALSENNEEGNY